MTPFGNIPEGPDGPRPPRDGPERSRIERALLSTLLRLYPPEFRSEFQDQWLAFVREQRFEDQYLRRPFGPLRFWTDVSTDVLASAARVRQERRRRSRNDRQGRAGASALRSIAQDLRFSLRTLSRRPLFSVVAVLTLGLGIGAATAMFSVVDGVLMADVPYRDPDRLMSIWQRLEGRAGYTETGETRLTYPQYKTLREQSSAFEDVAAYAGDWGESSLAGGSRPDLVQVGATTASLLPVLGVSPALGRWFLPEEEGADAGDRTMVTVMSHEVWVRRFAADSEILGSSVILNDLAYTVVGVLPPGFRIQWLSASITGADDPGPRDFWVPVGSPEWGESPGSTMWEAVGRLAEGVTLDRAGVETGQILRETWPSRRPEALLFPRMAEEVRGLGSPILLLFGATGLLLLIACGNVAALSLGEMHGRSQEIATRAAIGAGRFRIIRQLTTESVVLGVMGSALGAGLAVGGTNLLVALAPPIPRIDQVQVDLGVLAFSAALGTLSGLLFGLAPALHSARSGIGSSLRIGGRTASGHHAGLGRWVLTGEVALTAILMVGSGLLGQSLTHLLDVDLGFNPRNLATVDVTLPDARYGWDIDGAAWRFVDQVLLEMEAIPGVESASAANVLPFPDSPSEWASRANREDSTYLMPELFNVAPGYLDFMEIPILEGRGFLPNDGAEAPPVTVVNQALARALWGDRSPVGREMFYPMGRVTVVGVAGDTRQAVLQQRPPLTFYVPFSQHSRPRVTFTARTRGRPEDVLPAMREALWRVDGDLAITASGSLETAITDSASGERYRTLLITTFALLAMVLAAVGIGGVTARQVSHRTRELGIRRALGAQDGTLVVGVIRSAVLTGALGGGLGLLGAYLARPLLAGFVFGIGAFDPVTYAAIGAFILLVAVSAGYLPAKRLLRMDPVSVLKAE